MQEKNTNTVSEINESEDIDLRIIVKFIFRNIKFIGVSSLLFFFVSSIYALTLRRVWEGQFQIVLNSRENVQTNLDPRLQNFIARNQKSDLNTQVGILNSPSVLMPIFNYVKETKKNKEKIDDLVFSNWKKDLKVVLEDNTTILNISYRNTNKEIIIPVLEKISSTYQKYSGSKKQRIQDMTYNFLTEQISFYKKKSANSLKVAQEFAIDQNLNFVNFGSNENLAINNISNIESDNILIPNIGMESIRVRAVNELRSIDSQIKKIEELGDDFKKLQYIGSTIPAIVEEKLPLRLAEIEQLLAEKRTLYTEKDLVIKKLIEKRQLMIEVLKNRSIGYLQAKRLKVESKLEAASRPKGVILKYKELVREAQRDESTLINLENQLRVLELEKAKGEDPWELITSPTLLESPVGPSRKLIAIYGLFLGVIVGVFFQLIKERKTEIAIFLNDSRSN